MNKYKFFTVLYVTLIILVLLMFLYGMINSYIKNDKISLAINDRVSKFKDDITTHAIYIYIGKIKMGLYVNSNNQKTLVTDTYYTSFDPEDIMGVFYSIATNDKKIKVGKYKDIWSEYFLSYPKHEEYKIGYNIKFDMVDGRKIDQIILNPDDAYLLYPDIQFYLYDDVNLVPGKPYYHVTKETVTDKTIYTSIKLVGDKNTPDISSDIILDVFTYRGSRDFDKLTGKYIGGNIYSIKIVNEKRK